MTAEARQDALGEIAAEVRVCTRCRLHQHRTNAVPGEGHPDTEVVFVGEGPGYNEDQQGRPFVGAAGGLLTELLSSVGWRRNEVFITNVVKCRPPGNRDPEQDEIAACRPYLERQLQVLDPALVVTLGRFSMNTFMPGARIGSVHGTVRPVDPATGVRDAMVFAMYHPAAAFRQQALKETLKADMAEIPTQLIRARAQRAERRGATEQSSELSTEAVAIAVDVVPVAVPVEPVAPVTVDPAPAVAVEPVAVMAAKPADPPPPAEPAPAPSPTPEPVAVGAGTFTAEADLWEGFDIGPSERP